MTVAGGDKIYCRFFRTYALQYPQEEKQLD
jgi:hypothetical protein